MKNKKQVQRYLSNKTFKSEVDFSAIMAYCLQEYGYRIHLNPAYGPAISCSDFLNWIVEGYCAGDVVKWGDQLGIVYNVDPNMIHICFQTDRNTSNCDRRMIPIEDITKGDENDSEAVYELLRRAGKEFNYNTLDITPKYIPQTDDIVQFKRIPVGKKKEMCYGVVKSVAEDDVVMYCYTDENEKAHYSMEEHVGQLKDLQFEKITTESYGRKKLEEGLKAAGKSWNHFMKRIEPENMRVRTGQRYWYITDQMKTKAAIEDGKMGTVAHKRYLAGNYFRSASEAMKMQMDCAEYLKKHLAEPGV